jgi:hypothetical protein
MRVLASFAFACIVLLGLPRPGVAQPAPADHARLAQHFADLEAGYRAEAARHVTMADQLAALESKHPALPGHCRRLASLDTSLADEARDLAAYHAKAGGVTTSRATTDPAGEPLQALAAQAAAGGDHARLAEYFAAMAERYAIDARRHEAMAKGYQSAKAGTTAAVHCDRLARTARKAAEEARAAAGRHGALAATTR